jgi:hypothetical protein
MELELAFKLQESQIRYQTQVEIPITTADFYFAREPRPLIVFVDGWGPPQKVSDGQGRGSSDPIKEERIQGPRIVV